MHLHIRMRATVDWWSLRSFLLFFLFFLFIRNLLRNIIYWNRAIT